ncbi:MAG: hypothetical protein IKS48_12885 [Eubacterium sp.]|nr:hypothetical protein [Eubacterium sp.]
MFNDRLELCNGIVASFNDERNVYICYVPWLGRDIEVWLSAGDYEDDIEIRSLEKTFEKFWNDKSQLLTASQVDIKEKVIPYIVKKNASLKIPRYKEITADDFDADYWLTSIYVLCDVGGGIGEIQMNFYKDGDEDNDSFFVSRDLESGFLTFYVDMDMITDEI